MFLIAVWWCVRGHPSRGRKSKSRHEFIFIAAGLPARRGRDHRNLDLDDVKWHLGRFGELHARVGKGACGFGEEQS